MMDGDPVFVDTNVLIHANDADSPLQQGARTRLLSILASGSELWISRQVLREYAVVVSRKMSQTNTYDATALTHDLERFEAEFQVADEDGRVTAKLRQLILSHSVKGKPVHDANIVATMLVHGIRVLLTQNKDDFARYLPEIAILPLIPATLP